MAEKLTKKDAVRRALAELGNTAMPVALQGWIKDKLGIEMTAGHVSTTKGEILRKPASTATLAATPEPAPLPVLIVVEPVTPPTAQQAEKISKAAAVRRALSELGKKADRVQIQGFVKDRFGIEMSLDHVSSARAEAINKLAAKKKAAKQAKAATPTAAKETAPEALAAQPPAVKPATKASNGEAVLLADIVTLRGLLTRVKPDELRTLIDVMAK